LVNVVNITRPQWGLRILHAENWRFKMKLVMQGMMVQYLLNLEGEVVLAGNKPVPTRSIIQCFVCKTMKPEVVK